MPRKASSTVTDADLEKPAGKPKVTFDLVGLSGRGTLSWAEQGDEVRRLNSIMIAFVREQVEGGLIGPEIVSMLFRCSSTAKQWSQVGPSDLGQLTDEQIADLLKQRGGG
jgi:hypothetical protein